MSKKTIIDWQRDSLIVAVGQAHSGTVVIDRLSQQAIGHSAESAANEQDELLPLNGDAAQGLVRAVDELGLRKSDVTIILSRDLVEVRTLSIPRIEAAELPDVIRFQAQRQLANMGDAWTLDYVLLPDAPGQEMLTALVGAISPATLQTIETACEQAGITPSHIVLRPIEIARFVIASGKLPGNEPALVVCLSEQHADLLILEQGRIVQVRSTKLPSEAAQWQAALGGELRRSLMAAAVQLSNKSVRHALLIAAPAATQSAAELLSEMLDCQIAFIDPASLLSAEVSQQPQIVEHSAHRLAGIAGSLSLPTAAGDSKLDFKDPKKRPPPQKSTRTYVLAAVAALLLFVGGLTWWLSVQRKLDDQLAHFQSEIESRKAAIATAQERVTHVQEIDRFLQAAPNWLDEVAYLAERIPPSDKVLIGEPTFMVLNDGSGRITMPVAVDSSLTIKAFESSLRDEHYGVTGSKSTMLETPLFGRYHWRIDETITVRGRGWDLVSQLDTSRWAGKTPDATPNSATPSTPVSAAQTNN